MPRESKHWSAALEVLDACAVGVARQGMAWQGRLG